MMEEPEYCKKEYCEECEKCPYRDYVMVSHPGGDPYHSVEKYFCDFGHWEDDF